MDEIQQIVEGWKNLIFQNPVSEELGRIRLEKCLGTAGLPQCPQYKSLTKTCGMCGCYIPAMVRSSRKKCLKSRWPS